MYLALDRVAGIEVALKALSIEAKPWLEHALSREFQMLSGLAVPGVARVLDFGLMPAENGRAHDHRQPFFVRTYIEGLTLKEAIDGNHVHGVDVLECMVQLAHILASVHRAGMVHGDIKPNNIILDGRGNPWLIDFGLAGYHAGGSLRGGTPAFMAPELLKGESPTTQSDVYGLGATLWYALTGHAPFKRASELADATSARALEVASRALCPEPSKRTAAASEFAAALEAIAPSLKKERAYQVFVPPMLRGDEANVTDLELRVQRHLRHTKKEREPWSAWIAAEDGMGKSALLTQLRWRLQLSGIFVLHVDVRSHDAMGAMESLAQQTRMWLQDNSSQDMSQSMRDSGEDANFARLAKDMDELARRMPFALLIDNLDRAQVGMLEWLRALLYGNAKGALAVVATGRVLPEELAFDTHVTLEALGPAQVHQLTDAALGSVDDSVHRAIWQRTQGHPAQTLALLARLSDRGALSASDVRLCEISDAVRARHLALYKELSPEAQTLVQALVLAGGSFPKCMLQIPPPTSASEQTQRSSDTLLPGLTELERVHVVQRQGADVVLSHEALSQIVKTTASGESQHHLAAELLERPDATAFSLEQRAWLALSSGKTTLMAMHVPAACERGLKAGAISQVARWYMEWLPYVKGEERHTITLQLVELYQALGEYEKSVSILQSVLSDHAVSTERKAHARLMLGRVKAAQGDFAASLEELEAMGLPLGTSDRSLWFKERAKAYLNLGNYTQALHVTEEGLACTGSDDPACIELLTSSGMAHEYLGQPDQAAHCYERALGLAQRHDRKADEANVLNYMAIAKHRSGDFNAAYELYASSLKLARQLEDIGSIALFSLNLGVIEVLRGHYAKAEHHYAVAITSAKRAGKLSSDLMARANLAHLHVATGRYEQARNQIEDVMKDAVRLGIKRVQAQAQALMADINVRHEHQADGFKDYDDAIALYASLGQQREVAETHLDAVESALVYQIPSDLAACETHLKAAACVLDEVYSEDVRSRFAVLEGFCQVKLGHAEQAAASLEQALAEAKTRADRDLMWRASAALAQVYVKQPMQAYAYLREAHDVLCEIANGLPQDSQDTFWADTWKREIKANYERATQLKGRTMQEIEISQKDMIERDRITHLLDIVRRLVSEERLDRLLERITDGAISFFRAERGFVVLANAHGQLETHTARALGAASDGALSRSIAEAVFIDNTPIVTTDAAGDARLSEYRSVHNLMLRSVACVPIQGTSGVLGVLYLEHRSRRGRFHDHDLELLIAFADQAALAIEKTRMLEALRARTTELEDANAALAKAHQAQTRMLDLRTEELLQAQRELQGSHGKLSSNINSYGMVGQSTALRHVLERIERVAGSRVPVVVYGESGVGKELVARAIHESAQRQAPFVAVNCGALSEGLLESELFGHVKGSFTGADRDRRGVLAQAAGGTLFLDEIADMPPRMQANLLRVLQNGTYSPVGSEREEHVDVRIITASQQHLRQLVQEGRFREDLFYRLNVIEISVPALRNRKEDIPLLCEHFLAKQAAGDANKHKRLSHEALDALRRFDWPGNVRQLEHVLLNACILAHGSVIEAKDISFPDLTKPTESAMQMVLLPADEEAYDGQERLRMLNALSAHQWNRAAAARALGMPRRTFYRRLKSHGIA